VETRQEGVVGPVQRARAKHDILLSLEQQGFCATVLLPCSYLLLQNKPSPLLPPPSHPIVRPLKQGVPYTTLYVGVV
jgi:hypothetical protein